MNSLHALTLRHTSPPARWRWSGIPSPSIKAWPKWGIQPNVLFLHSGIFPRHPKELGRVSHRPKSLRFWQGSRTDYLVELRRNYYLVQVQSRRTNRVRFIDLIGCTFLRGEL